MRPSLYAATPGAASGKPADAAGDKAAGRERPAGGSGTGARQPAPPPDNRQPPAAPERGGVGWASPSCRLSRRASRRTRTSMSTPSS